MSYVAALYFSPKSTWKEPISIGLLALLLIKVFGVDVSEYKVKIFGSVIAADFIYNKYKANRAL